MKFTLIRRMKIKSSMYFNTSKMSKNSKKAKINSKILNVSDSNSSETMSDFITSFKNKHNDLCNDIKQETDESFLDISICSQLSDASKERNEAFHKWLMAQPDATPKIPEFSNRLEKLQWLQKQRDIGVYVICDNCDKMRYLKDVKDPLELPKYWYCTMNPGKKFYVKNLQKLLISYIYSDEHQNNCSYSQITLTSLELRELVNNIYNAGSIVWAKVEGHPWMPAMIDDDPDLETFFFTGNDLAYDDPVK